LNSATTVIVSGGDGLVAIGFNGGFGSILWTSSDRSEWHDVTPADFASFGLASAIELADGSLVAVGRGDTINVDADLAAAYLSQDGLVWEQVADDPDLRGQLIDVIEAADETLLAVGGVPGADSAGFWRSTDSGVTWERTGDELPASFLWSVAQGGPGFVAVGWRRTPDPSAAVWTSTDGTNWEAATDPEGFEGFEGIDVVATPSGALVMAGGFVAGGEGRIWTSRDGVDWSTADVNGGLTDAGIRHIVVSSTGLIGVGSTGTDAALWLSTDDGATWAPFGDPVPDAYFTNAFATDAGLVLTGATQTGTLETGIEGNAAIWLATFGE
jgi:hypothetical protein